MLSINLKNFILLGLINLFALIISKENNIYTNLSRSLRESQAVKILNNAIVAGHKLDDTTSLELMNKRKWLEASKLIIDFLIDVNDSKQINIIKQNNEEYVNYLKNLKDSLKTKKKNIVKISPVFEWSQDNRYVKMRVKFAKNLEAPGEIDIQDLFVNVTRTNFHISGYKVHEDYLVHYNRLINLQANIKASLTDGYKETDGSYIIRLQKETETLYWTHLDLQHDSHHNMFTWFEVFTNYENKAGFTSWRDKTNDNILDSDIEDYKRGKKEQQIKRVKKIANNAKIFRTVFAQNKNFCMCPVGTKYCNIPKPTDWSYWQV